MEGAVVVFSGFTDAQLSLDIMAKGGVVRTKLSGKTTMVVNKPGAKNKTLEAARANPKIRIVTIEEFKAEFLAPKAAIQPVVAAAAAEPEPKKEKAPTDIRNGVYVRYAKGVKKSSKPKEEISMDVNDIRRRACAMGRAMLESCNDLKVKDAAHMTLAYDTVADVFVVPFKIRNPEDKKKYDIYAVEFKVNKWIDEARYKRLTVKMLPEARLIASGIDVHVEHYLLDQLDAKALIDEEYGEDLVWPMLPRAFGEKHHIFTPVTKNGARYPANSKTVTNVYSRCITI